MFLRIKVLVIKSIQISVKKRDKNCIFLGGKKLKFFSLKIGRKNDSIFCRFLFKIGDENYVTFDH